ncbi:MAG: helix-turn-helix domain-containing protein [Candidatus Bathyarchaeia archaeon]
MSANDEEPYSTIFASLKHPIRRRILRMLSVKPMSFSEMLEVLGVSSSFLNYHIENLGELVGKTEDGKYKLSSFGEAAMATMMRVEDIPRAVPQQLSRSAESSSHEPSGPRGIIAKIFKMDRTTSRKVVRRSVAISLGIICILLIASLGGALAYYTMIIHNKENELGSANNTISQLNTNATNLQNQDKQLQTWLDGNKTLLNQTQTNNTNLRNQIDFLNSNATNLQNQVNNFHIGSTENSTIWVNNEIVHTNEIVYDAETGENLTLIGVVRAIYVPSAGYVSVRVSSNNNSTFVGLGTPYVSGTNVSFPTYDQFNVGFGGTVVFPVLPTSFTDISFGSSIGEATLAVTITYYY